MPAGTITTVATIESGPAAAGAAAFNKALAEMRAGLAQTKTRIDELTGVSNLLRGALTTVASAFAVKGIVEAADNYTRLKLRIQDVSGSAEEAAATLTKIREAARNARTSASDLSSAYVAMSLSLKEKGRTENEAIRSLELLAKAMQSSGATTEQVSGALEALSTGFIRGRFEMRSFFSLMEQAPVLMRELQQQTGMSGLQLRKMAELGKISGETIMQVLLNSADKIESRFATVPRTVGGAFTALSNQLTSTLGRAFSDSSSASSEFVAALDRVRKALASDSLVRAIRDAADSAGYLVGKFIDLAKAMKEHVKVYEQVDAEKATETWGQYFDKLGSGIKRFHDIVDMGFVKWRQYAAAAEGAEQLARSVTRAALLDNQNAIGAFKTTVTPATTAQRPVTFAESDLEKQTRIAIAAERDRLDLIRARAIDDRAAIAASEEELAVKQKVTKELREANPLLAGQFEAQIRLNAQAEREADIRRQNNEVGRQAFETINSGIIESIKNGEGFNAVLRKMTAQLVEMAARVAVLKPLEKSFGNAFGGALTGAGFNPEKGLLGLFGFAEGGVFDSPVQFMSGGKRAQMAENGPEAIVPLRRGADGRLGVSVAGGPGSVQQSPTYVFNVAGDMTDQTAEKVRQICRGELQRSTPGLISASVSQVQRENVRNPNFLKR